MKSPALGLTLSLAFLTVNLSPALGQDDDDEVFELSPFMVEAPHSASTTLTGTRVSSKTDSSTSTGPNITNSGASISGIQTGDFTSFGPDTIVRIDFAVGFYDDEETVRRDTLNEYLDQIAAVIESEPELIFESGAILVPEGDKSRLKGVRRAAYTSYAHFKVSFATDDVESPFEKTRSVRRLVGGIDFESKYAKIFYGNAQLAGKSLRNDSSLQLDLGAQIRGVEGQGIGANSLSRPEMAVALIKTADAIRLDIHTEFRGSRKEEAMEGMNQFLDTLNGSAGNGIEFIPTTSTLIQPATASPLSDAEERYRVIGQVKALITLDSQIEPESKIIELKRAIIGMESASRAFELRFGSARLVVNNPDKYRAEILEAISEDIQFMDQALGEDFGVELSIGPSRVRLWQHSDSQVELWLPYTFTVFSNRERTLEELRLSREHEVAMKDTRPQIICCGQSVKAETTENE